MKLAFPKSRALRFVLLIGVMSFFADFTYEASRGIVGPYLALLGASAALVAFITGFGELLGYGLRVVSGGLSDKTGQFWPITIFGYVIQMASVPLLALAGNWQLAAILVILERVGKAIRNPPRDVMLSHAAKEMGYGWGFGVHEALDQFGLDRAVLAPLEAHQHPVAEARRAGRFLTAAWGQPHRFHIVAALDEGDEEVAVLVQEKTVGRAESAGPGDRLAVRRDLHHPSPIVDRGEHPADPAAR